MTEEAQTQPNEFDPQKNGRAQKSASTPAVKAERPQPEVRKQDEDPVGKVYDSVLIRRLGHYLKPYWLQATISAISVTLKSLADVTGPYLVKIGIDLYMVHKAGASTTWVGRRLSPDPWHGITQLAEIYIAVLCLQYLFEFIQTYLMQWVGQKIMFDLRRDIFRHMQQLARGLLRYPCGGAAGHPADVRRGRHQ